MEFNETVPIEPGHATRNVAFLLARFGNFCSHYGKGKGIKILKCGMNPQELTWGIHAIVTDNPIEVETE